MPSEPASRRVKLISFREDCDGTAAVEFAMIGGLLTFLLMGVMQIGFYIYTAAALEYAVAQATRQVMTGSASAGSMTADQFRSGVLCPLLPVSMSCARVITNINTVPEAASPGGFYQYVNSNASWIIPPAMDNTKTNFCTGAGGSVVYAQVYYAMPIYFPVLFKGVSGSWQGNSAYFVGAFAAFRNEPFQASSNGGC
jgi:Flp pilus assembly protein TadG